MRRALATGGSGALLILIMLGGGIVLWVGVPVGWLYIGSQIQASTGSLGTAMAAMMIGAIASILVIVALGLGLGVGFLPALLAAGLASFGASFYWLRELFRRRSGGLSFR